MNSVLSALQPHPQLSSNGFDVSHRDVFSTKPGIALPCFYRHVPYKSTFRIDVANIIETTTLQTNAFARGSFNLDFYFVPYSQLYRHSDEIILGRGQSNRNIGNGPLVEKGNHKTMPLFRLGNVLNVLFQEWLIGKSNGTFTITGTSQFTDIFNENAAEDALRLLDMLGYGNFLPMFKYVLSSTSFDRNMSNLEFMSAPFTSPSQGFVFESIVEQALGRTLSESEYDSLNTPTNSQVMCMLSGAFKVTLVSSGSGLGYQFVSKHYNVFNLAAYQKIWSDMYRNFIYDTADYTSCFNFDWLLNNDPRVSVVDQFFGTDLMFVKNLLMPRYRQWKKDLFTGTYPSAQFGDVAFQQVSDGNISVIDGDSTNPVKLDVSATASDGQYALVSDFSHLPEYGDILDKFRFNGVGISALDIRYTMSMQRYRERILRAGNRTKDVLEAQYGISSRYIEDDYVEFLGSFSGTLNINKVAGTTNEGNTSIGELGAYGNAQISGKQIERSFNDYGIVMGILTFVPETEYDALMVDPFNTKSEQFDYYQPDFENLGLAPVFGYELDPRLGSQVLGYTARYHEYKMAIDKVHGEFHGAYRPLVADVAYRYPNQLNEETNSGVFSDYVTPRDLYYMSSNNWLARYYINPKCMNNVFLLAVGNSQDTDPFKIDMNNFVSSVQPMSVTGLPNL